MFHYTSCIIYIYFNCLAKFTKKICFVAPFKEYFFHLQKSRKERIPERNWEKFVANVAFPGIVGDFVVVIVDDDLGRRDTILNTTT